MEEDIFYRSNISFLGSIFVTEKGIYGAPAKGFIKVENKNNIFLYLWKYKRFLIKKFREKTEDDDLYVLGLALIFGEKGFLDKDLKEVFISSGLTHLLAISGLHIAIIISILIFVFSFFSKKIAYYLTGGLLTLYPVFTGLHIPVLRSSMMGILYIIAKIKYIKIQPMNILFFVGFVILLFSPKSLFSVSFQLSFIAVFGILLGLKYINFETENKFMNFTVSALIMSVIATIFTMPVVLYHFGKFAPVSIISTPVSMFFIYPYLFFSVLNLFTFFSLSPFVFFMNLAGKLFLETAYFFDKLELFTYGYSPDIFLVLSYLAGVSVLLIIKINHFIRFLLILSSVIIFLLFSKTEIRNYKIYVFKGKFSPEILLIAPQKECFVYQNRENYRIKTLMDKYGCYRRYLFVKNNRYYDGYDKYLFLNERFKGILLKKEEGRFSVEIGDEKINIKNSNYFLEIQ
ncbi:ComEC/Rec2 family competence protein [Persephonella sp.]